MFQILHQMKLEFKLYLITLLPQKNLNWFYSPSSSFFWDYGCSGMLQGKNKLNGTQLGLQAQKSTMFTGTSLGAGGFLEKGMFPYSWLAASLVEVLAVGSPG